MKFEWDPKKAESNFAKHQISFAEALTIFESNYLEVGDLSSEEARFKAIGVSLLIKVLVVVYCYRENDIIRIISARKATKHEEALFQKRI